MLEDNPDVFRDTFRRGQVYNNNTRGIQCRAERPVTWVHGATIMKYFKDVSIR